MKSYTVKLGSFVVYGVKASSPREAALTIYRERATMCLTAKALGFTDFEVTAE